ncbi:MAG: tetratricopeptide repeat protein [Candidatus Obscuribacterales bacterium]|nr:tetratricopeptide repeat protein [Candidatus Obscuribacterales bacterium]
MKAKILALVAIVCATARHAVADELPLTADDFPKRKGTGTVADAYAKRNLAWSLYEQGLALRKANKLDEAIAKFKLAISTSPFVYTEFLEELGQCLRQQGKTAEAREVYKKALVNEETRFYKSKNVERLKAMLSELADER